MKTMKNWLLAAVLVAALTAVVACGGKYLSHTYRAEKTLKCSTLALDDQTGRSFGATINWETETP